MFSLAGPLDARWWEGSGGGACRCIVAEARDYTKSRAGPALDLGVVSNQIKSYGKMQKSTL
jgi:hypothetical protein